MIVFIELFAPLQSIKWLTDMSYHLLIVFFIVKFHVGDVLLVIIKVYL